METAGIGLLGFGTIGAGVIKGLQDNGELLGARLGTRPVLRRVADIDLDSDRGVSVDRALLTHDVSEVIRDPSVDVVVELIGGTGIARRAVREALECGKPVVTANKALLAKHGAEIFGLSEARNVDIYFGASVGGGIPIIRALREGLIANRIDRICGILNGTCNYILTRMERQGLAFDAALAEAQAKGYAEADPGLDIDGHDTAHKAAILASLAYGSVVPLQAVHVEGIGQLSTVDIRYALELGYRIKLLAVIRRTQREVEARVHPALVPLDHVLASVSGVYNAVMVEGDLVGRTLYYGRGAGRDPTASTVLGDIADVVRNLRSGSHCRVPAVSKTRRPYVLRKLAQITTRYYLRLSVADQPGVLARIAAVLGEHGISMASVLQKEVTEGDHVHLVMVTHEAKEAEVDAALRRIDGMDTTAGSTVRIRIEGDQ